MTNETKIQHYYRSIGRCPRCHGRNVLMGDEKNCPECRAKAWEYDIRYKASHPGYAEKKKSDAQARRAFRVANGICTICGKGNAENGFKTCEKCREYHKYRMRRRRASQ